MEGVITTRHLLFHAPTIVRLFGTPCYLRCLRAALRGRRCTFLGVLCESGAAQQRREQARD